MLRKIIQCVIPLIALGLSACTVDATAEPSDAEGDEATSEAEQAITFAVPDLWTQFYAPPHAGPGDRDFGGHGPYLSFDVELAAEGNQVVAYVYVDAIETKKDWTRVAGSERQVVYTAPSPVSIVSSPTSFHWQYTDHGHGDDGWLFPETPAEARLVKYLRCVGDTAGNDVWKTGCEVAFHPITVQY